MTAPRPAVDGPRPLVTVAFDGGPMLGAITGVGAAVTEMASALRARTDVALRTYALSFRGQLHRDMTRLPLPAMVAQRLWSRTDLPRLDHWIRPAQVVHGTNYVVGPSRLPRVVTVYDCWFLRNTDDAGADVVRAGEVLRRSVASGATVHASSQSTADAVRELLQTERVEVIPLAALPRLNASAEGVPALAGRLRGAPFVLSIGTQERRKNVPTLVAAFVELVGQMGDDLADLHLVLVGGDGDDTASIDAAIGRAPTEVRRRVVRAGRVDDRTKQWLLSSARAFAYPSLDEGFGFPLLEAMQFDLPVVASNRGSIPEVAGDAALLIDPLDVSALARALGEAITDSTIRARLADAGRTRLTTFSWSATAASLADLYHRLAQAGPA